MCTHVWKCEAFQKTFSKSCGDAFNNVCPELIHCWAWFTYKSSPWVCSHSHTCSLLQRENGLSSSLRETLTTLHVEVLGKNETKELLTNKLYVLVIASLQITWPAQSGSRCGSDSPSPKRWIWRIIHVVRGGLTPLHSDAGVIKVNIFILIDSGVYC